MLKRLNKNTRKGRIRLIRDSSEKYQRICVNKYPEVKGGPEIYFKKKWPKFS